MFGCISLLVEGNACGRVRVGRDGIETVIIVQTMLLGCFCEFTGSN